MLWHRAQSTGAISYSDAFFGERALAIGGILASTSPGNQIEYFSIPLGGTTVDFGDLTGIWGYGTAFSGFGRGIISGGIRASAVTAVQDYVTIATPGNSLNFGNLTQARLYLAGCSNGTRGISSGGTTASDGSVVVNTTDYITIATTGNSVDFGDLSAVRLYVGGFDGRTRGIIAGGAATNTFGSQVNTIEYFTFNSLGNAVDFGDLSFAVTSLTGSSNGVRAVMHLSYAYTSVKIYERVLNYINVDVSSNSFDFGSFTRDTYGMGASGNSYRCAFYAGVQQNSSTQVSDREYVNINTPGNAVDFGNLLTAQYIGMGLSGN